MQHKIHQIQSFLRYRMKAKGLHALHSPFVFDFASKVLHDKTDFPEYKLLDDGQKALLADFMDYANSDLYAKTLDGKPCRDASQIEELKEQGKQALGQQKLLFRISNYLRPNNILDIGTINGLNTFALGLGNPQAKIVGMTNCAASAEIVEKNLHLAGRTEFQIKIQDFDDVLEASIFEFNSFDLIFFSKNNSHAFILEIVEQYIDKLNDNSLVIFEAIYRSKEMTKAWKQIKNHPKVSLSMDLYHFGLIFFKSGIIKQHFVLRNS